MHPQRSALIPADGARAACHWHLDYATPPVAGGFFLGDYDGLTSSGTTFKAFFAMSRPIATAGRSDLFSNIASAGGLGQPLAYGSVVVADERAEAVVCVGVDGGQ